ncbi:hypothetical protein QN277_005530 [Acacia crassicarpa]|uniref:Uncharacterized protein n=1 Tax=Acacia crassicarpa TaxID=499986 RepID=A0AAE1IXC2_9FABA|nr:hypothetical protein QN277_005530 [Acacia crassicarpa]
MSEQTTLSNNNEDDSEISNCIHDSSFTGLNRNQVIFDDEEGGGGGGGDGLDLDFEPDSDSDSGLGLNDRKEKGNLDVIREEDCESSVFSLDFRACKDVVHVCVGKYGDDKSSLEALSWTLKHWITPFTTLCLLHVFPLVKLIPSPLGKLPRSHVNKAHIDLYLDKHKCKRKLLLQKFIDLCLASQVKVETMLTEGDNVANSIVDVINDIGVCKLVVGITKSNLRKSGSPRSKGIADEVVRKAPENCDVKVICEGKDVIFDIVQAASPSSTGSGSTPTSGSSRKEDGSSRGFGSSKNFFGFGPRIPFSAR